jgi:hypothetical protein
MNNLKQTQGEQKVSAENGTYELECGCKCEYINGRYIVFQCDDHEYEYENTPHTKRTKMRNEDI